MQVKIFTLPIHGCEQMEEEANRFLRSHRVMTVDRQFSPDGGGYWTLFITYQDGLPSAGGGSGVGVSRSGKVDYREVLSPEEFGRFALYRDIRKEMAVQQGVPAYAIFTDEELSLIARMETVTLEAIAAIKNVGKRAEKYGMAFVSASLEKPDAAIKK